jgi:hypothetical protein
MKANLCQLRVRPIPTQINDGIDLGEKKFKVSLPKDPIAVRPKKQKKLAGHILLRAPITFSSNPVQKFGSGN